MSYRTSRSRKTQNERNRTIIPLLLLPVLLVVIVTTVLVVHFTTRGSTLLVDPCGLNLCENNSTCVNTTNTTSGFLCTCLPGFNGTFCENTVVTVCDSTCEYSTPQLNIVGPAPNIFRSAIRKGPDGSLYVSFSIGVLNPFPINTFNVTTYVGKFLNNGTVDTTFGVNGYIIIESPSITANPTDFLPLDDGAFVFLDIMTNQFDPVRRLWKTNADGTIDINFPVITPAPFTGPIIEQWSFLIEGKNGGFFLHQYETSASDIDHFLKYTSTGLDLSYGTSGRATYSIVTLLAIPDGNTNSATAISFEDGSLILLFSVENNLSIRKAGVLKLTPSGALDTSFGVNGIYWDTNAPIFYGPFNPIGAILSDGSIIYAGWGLDTDYSTEITVVFKITPLGQLDTSWGVGGYFVHQCSPYSEVYMISADPCDNVIVGVSCYDITDKHHILKLDANGVLNPSYPLEILDRTADGFTSVITGGEFVGDPLYYHTILRGSGGVPQETITIPCV